MKFFRRFLPFLLVSNSLGNCFCQSIRQINSSSDQLLKFTLFNSFKQPVCKMSTSIKEEVDRQKSFYESMSLNEKRKLYACGTKYVTLNDISSWKNDTSNQQNEHSETKYQINPDLNDKVSVWRGDITSLEIDAIVNAANSRLAGGGGVDGAIHSAAGRQLLLNECGLAGGLPTGNSLLTSGYKLPAKKIIHTVGPVGEKADLLKSCYENSLNLAKQNNLRSIAFPCVSTGVYGYPNEKAANVALQTVREWLEKNGDSIDRIIFCLFLPIDVEIYNKLLPVYFPK